MAGAPVLGGALLVLMAGSGWAQNANSGDIRGTVTDISGAVVPGVAVDLLELKTGFDKKLTTNGVGVYDAVSILPGTYRLTFTRSGFQTFVRSGITLDVGAITVNAKLQVGSETETVVVQGEGTLLKTDTGEQGATLEAKTIRNLPNVGTPNGQDWTSFINTLPGVNGNGATAAGAEVTVNGNMPYQDSFLEDGGSVTSAINSSLTPAVFDTLAEVKVDTSNFSAEYGVGGAVFNQVTRGGTNKFHGDVYEYVQNEFFNARSYFSPTVPILHYNNWGGSIGGPVLRDKMFFFFNYDRMHNLRETFGFHSVPTAAMRAGDFSAAGFPTIYNPHSQTAGGTRTPFQNNVIPSNLLDPTALKIQQYFPMPNLPGTANNYQVGLTISHPLQRYFGRIDYNIGQKNRLTATVAEQDNPSFEPSITCPIGCYTDDTTSNAIQITDVWTFSPAADNEFHMAFSRAGNYSVSEDQGGGYPATLGLSYAEADVFPNISVSGSSGTGSNSIGTGPAYRYVENIFEPSDVVTLIRGKNIFKFGGEFLSEQANLTQYGNVNAGSFSFTGYYTEASPLGKGGIGYADFLLGQVQSWGATNSPEVGMRSKNPQVFFEDDLKATSNFTLNLGLRFERQTGWGEIHNRIGDFDPNLTNPVTHTLGSIWFPGADGRTALQFPVNNVLPRLGFSWTPTPAWAIRGGYGMFTYGWSVDTYSDAAIAFGAQSTGSLQNTNGVAPVFLLGSSNPPLNYTKASTYPGAYNGQSVPYYPAHTPVTIVNQYSLSIQRQLRADTVAEIAFVGSSSNHLSFASDVNQVPEDQLGPNDSRPYPQYLTISGNSFNAISDYNSLQASVKKQYRNGLMFDTNFTWSHMLDDQDSGGWGGHFGGQVYQNAYTPSDSYGPSDFDLPYMLKAQAVYQLPVGVGERWLNHPGVLAYVLGGWQASGLFVTHSGFPYSLTVGGANKTNAQGGNWFPNHVGNPRLQNPTIQEWFNTAAFAAPAAYTFGNVHRNSLRGPGLTDLDLSARKNFILRRAETPWNLQVGIDAYNALNHTVFSNPNGSIGTSNAGRITGTQIAGRTIQLSARFAF